MSKVFKILLVLILSFIFCISFVYASDVTMDLPSNDTSLEGTNEDASTNEITDENLDNATTDNSLADEYLEGSTDENTTLPEDPLANAYSHEQAVGISTNSSGLSVASIINILLIAVGIIIIFLAIAIIIRLK